MTTTATSTIATAATPAILVIVPERRTDDLVSEPHYQRPRSVEHGSPVRTD